MKIKEIVNALEIFAPLPLQDGFDNAGLQIGLTDAEATGALLCLDRSHHAGVQPDCIPSSAHLQRLQIDYRTRLRGTLHFEGHQKRYCDFLDAHQPG